MRLIGTVSILLFVTLGPAHAQEAAKTNIVLILMNEYGWGEPGVYGGGGRRR